MSGLGFFIAIPITWVVLPLVITAARQGVEPLAWTVAPFVIAFGYAWGATLLSKARRVGIHQLAFVLAAATLAAAHDGALTFWTIVRAVVGAALLIYVWDETA